MSVAALDTLAATQADLIAQFEAGTINEAALSSGLALALNTALAAGATPLAAALAAQQAISRLTDFVDLFLGNTGLKVLGVLAAEGDLPTDDNAIGDGYLIDSDLWVWAGSSWVNAGPIQGADGTDGTDGDDAWTPVFAAVADGVRRVLRVTDWTGGDGDKPTTGLYLGPLGLTATLAEATDVRGAAAIDGEDGSDGIDGWSPVLAAVADGARRVHQVVDWVGGEGAKPTTGLYVGAAGLVAAIGDGVDVRGPSGANGAGTGDVLGPAVHATGRVPVWGGADSKTLTEGRPIGTANDTDLLDKAGAATLFRTQAQVDAAISAALDALLAGAPGALNTLDELAAALGDDANFAASVTNALAGKLGLAGGTLTGRVKLHAFTEKAATYTAGAIDTSTGSVSDAGVINANVTISFASLPAGPATGDTVTEVLRATISGTPVITWPSGIVWAANTAPTLAAGAWEFVISARWTGSAWAYRGAWTKFF